jgi:hypothetical protein
MRTLVEQKCAFKRLVQCRLPNDTPHAQFLGDFDKWSAFCEKVSDAFSCFGGNPGK